MYEENSYQLDNGARGDALPNCYDIFMAAAVDDPSAIEELNISINTQPDDEIDFQNNLLKSNLYPDGVDDLFSFLGDESDRLATMPFGHESSAQAVVEALSNL